jgi:hypothetical protein
MRDTMIINVSGIPGHAMGIDLNIEHLIGYLKALFAAKGIYSNWDRLGNISAVINHIQKVKIQVARSMCASYQGSTHQNVDTSNLVWCIADKARDLQLLKIVPNREGQSSAKAVPDLRASGREKFATASLATFNKKIRDMASGRCVAAETDELPPPDFTDAANEELDNGDGNPETDD